MDNDDEPVGRVLSRREVLKLLGAASAAALVGCIPRQETAATVAPPTAAAVPLAPTVSTPTLNVTTAAEAIPNCVVRPAMTEGPYFVDTQLNRSDIRTDPASGVMADGALLALTMRVLQIRDGVCGPLEGAVVDIWHCDAAGVYSGVNDGGFNTVGQQFLRGYQETDANGLAQFTTIYPGWYPGRAVHIHFKVRKDSLEFTSQLFFDDDFSANVVYAAEPYASKGTQNTLNSSDGIYRSGGSQLQLVVSPTAAGYATTFEMAMDMG
ncbi:MAG: intradiol ring-cleavage dioxygenase [Chloroflexi bacterium]|nr:intradiol ring-cleavage dioxygenase [Chloroflexota bacterium]